MPPVSRMLSQLDFLYAMSVLNQLSRHPLLQARQLEAEGLLMLLCGGHQVMTFKPAISKRAHDLPSRSFEELSEGDRLRRDCYLVSHLSVFCNTICCLSAHTAQNRLHELLSPTLPSATRCPWVTIT